MHKKVRATCFIMMLTVFTLPTLGWALNDIVVIQGKILSVNKQFAKNTNYSGLINYTIRIKTLTGQDTSSHFITASISVKAGSLNDEIIKVAKKNGNVCQFSLSRRGMRYTVHQIFLLEGKSFGQMIRPNADSSNILLSGDAVYHDKNKKVIMNNRKTVVESEIIGNGGISIGN